MLISYESTRNSNLKVTASEAVLNGIAHDGGLFVMRNLKDKKIDIEKLLNKSYTEISGKVLKLMLDDFPEEKINDCISKAYTKKFSTEEITPVVKVGGCYITELFHGPTSAFKDVALSILPHLITASYEMNDRQGEVIILTATSGDTGKAALEGFKDIEGTKIIVFYPEDGVSQVQKAQMVTQEGLNTHVCAIKGNFDDAQFGVKKLFTDKNLIENLMESNKVFSSANSINIGRLIPQIVYYFYTYIKLVEKDIIKLKDKINFSVPTGNFGNILAGYYAKQMGLPINKLICASNENNVLFDFINTGIYDRNRQFYKTISPSMDIVVSSNLERLLYFLYDKDNNEVKKLMDDLSLKGRYEVNEKVKSKISSEFYGGCVFAKDTEITIKEVFEKDGYLLDTHTAVAYKTLEDYKAETGDNTISVVLSTASPFKFSRSVYKALFDTEEGQELEIMYELSKKTGIELPTNLQGLENKPVIHNKVCEIDKMEEYVRTIVKQ